jgi:hypothetical protein
MICIYRISNNSYIRPRLKNATKEHCFLNFIKNILLPQDFLHVLADNINEDLKLFLQNNLPPNSQILEVNTGSNGGSFRLQLSMVNSIADDEIVLIHEDDYLYRPHPQDSEKFKKNNYLIAEALLRSHYVSLYDHPDKYMLANPEGLNRISFSGTHSTEVFLTSGTHWKYTDSTTLTFAAKAKTLKEDMGVWIKHIQGNHPDDFQAFLELRGCGRTIATPIPGLSTHADPIYQSPFTNWDAI